MPLSKHQVKAMKTSHFAAKYGPYALVAGGSDGLGFAFAEAIARRGLNLVLIARREERLKMVTRQLQETYGVDIVPITADLADTEQVIQRVSALKATIGLLVYNAAFAPIGSFEKTSDTDLALAASVNVNTPLLLVKLLSGPMIKQKRGGIVLMSSLAGVQGSPNLAAYAATKSFNAILAEGLWYELKQRGIDVLACCAGAVLTPGYLQAAKARPAPGALDARKIAEQTLNALGSGPIIVPGFINKAARFLFTRVLSRKAAIVAMAKISGGLS